MGGVNTGRNKARWRFFKMSQSNRMAEFRHQDREGYLRWDDTSADDQDIWPVELP